MGRCRIRIFEGDDVVWGDAVEGDELFKGGGCRMLVTVTLKVSRGGRMQPSGRISEGSRSREGIVEVMQKGAIWSCD